MDCQHPNRSHLFPRSAALTPAMQSMPLLLRQSLRSSLQLTRTTARPVQVPHVRPTPPSAFPARPTARSFSVCLQCQFRRLPGSYSPLDEKERREAELERIIQSSRQGVAPEGVPNKDAAAGTSRADSSEFGVPLAGQTGTKQDDVIYLKSPEAEPGSDKAQGSTAGAQSGGLPSYLENRRSQMSKQFTTMMDNIQANVFVAGQRLNDLTGYSAIEALKRDIQTQGTNRQRTSRTTACTPTNMAILLTLQKPASVKLAHTSAKPKKPTQPQSTTVPPRSAKSTSSSSASTPGPQQTWSASPFSTATTTPTRSPRQRHKRPCLARSVRPKRPPHR